MKSKSDNSKKSENVVSLASFREKKAVEKEFARGRDPLFVSHLDGKMKGSPHLNRRESDDFGDRLKRIRTSLEKINRLMGDLKKISKDETRRSGDDKKTVSILPKR